MPTSPHSIIDAATIDDIQAVIAEASAAGNSALRAEALESQQAAAAANEGRFDDARRILEQALATTNEPRLLFLGFQFHLRVAEMPGVCDAQRAADILEAERMVRRRLAIAETLSNSPHLGRALTNLGIVLQYKGTQWHAEAERHFRRAIEVDRHLGNEEGFARAVGNLGNFLECTGSPDRAEPLYREALAIARRIGAGKLVASQTANLGDIAAGRGERDTARALWMEALEVYRTLGLFKWVGELEAKIAAPPHLEP